ncbi:MAG: hypothetical protein U0350_25500 [Caldilineaceae bacterium]
MNIDGKTLLRARQALNEAVRGWIYDPNVRLIDLGWPARNGRLIKQELAIRIHVAEKIEQGLALEIATMEGVTRGLIPATIGGFPVDVPQGAYHLHQVRPPVPQPRTGRVAPLEGGISVANARLRGSGTLGGMVIDRATGVPMILSNWHVLVGLWEAQPGWPICQPGPADGGSTGDTVAKLTRNALSANLDAAVAELTGDRPLINDQLGLGPLKGVGLAASGMGVVKSGRTSGVTFGQVSGVEGTAKMNYAGVTRLIQHVMTIDPREVSAQVSAGGDSGSFWIEEATMKVVGLHFAGGDNPERALAIAMQPILDALKVDIAV